MDISFLRLDMTVFGGPAMVAHIREIAVTRGRNGDSVPSHPLPTDGECELASEKQSRISTGHVHGPATGV